MNEKTLVLIPCCGSKNRGGIPTYYRGSCIVNYLSPEAGRRLMELRKYVAVAFGDRFGSDVGVEESETQIEFMRAYERYKGKLYCRISRDSWEKLNTSQNLSLLVISAFYGVVRHDEFIRFYNRAMKDKIEGKQLKTWWKKHRLCDILIDYIITSRIRVVHDFLSLDYSEAVQPFQSEIRRLGVAYIAHDYSGFGSGSNYHRGEDVERLIQSF